MFQFVKHQANLIEKKYIAQGLMSTYCEIQRPVKIYMPWQSSEYNLGFKYARVLNMQEI